MSEELKTAVVVKLSKSEHRRLQDWCVKQTQRQGEQVPVAELLSALLEALERGEVKLEKNREWQLTAEGTDDETEALKQENERLKRELAEQQKAYQKLVREKCEETTLRVADKLKKVVEGLDLLNIPVAESQVSEWYLTKAFKQSCSPGAIKPILSNLLALKEQGELETLSWEELAERVQNNEDDDKVYESLDELARSLKLMGDEIKDRD